MRTAIASGKTGDKGLSDSTTKHSVVTANDTITATPPPRGMGVLLTLLPPGLSTIPILRLKSLAIGVRMSDSVNAPRNTSAYGRIACIIHMNANAVILQPPVLQETPADPPHWRQTYAP